MAALASGAARGDLKFKAKVLTTVTGTLVLGRHNEKRPLSGNQLHQLTKAGDSVVGDIWS